MSHKWVLLIVHSADRTSDAVGSAAVIGADRVSY